MAKALAARDACPEGNAERVSQAAGAYPIVDAPGRAVARVQCAITDLKQNRPILDDVASYMPVARGQSVLNRDILKPWAGSGATRVEMIISDSATDEVIAAAKDEKTAALKERFTKWGTAEDAFKYYADRLRAFLDESHSEAKRSTSSSPGTLNRLFLRIRFLSEKGFSIVRRLRENDLSKTDMLSAS